MSAKVLAKRTINFGLVVAVLVIAWITIFHYEWIVLGFPKAPIRAISSNQTSAN